MNKFIYIACTLFILAASPSYAQTTKKGDKKTEPTTTNTSAGYTTIYIIDGVRPASPMDFFKIKSEDIFSINTVTDQAEIAKKYARKGEKLNAVIVVETVKNKPKIETAVSSNPTSAPAKN